MNERIKTVRKNAKLNQTEFANVIGASRDRIASYETGRVVPDDTILKLISKEFGISYAWLKTGDGPMEDPVPDEKSLDKLTETYHALPARLKSLVDALAQMTPDWYKILDDALAAVEQRRKEEGDAE